MQVYVLGAGVAGLATALWLRRAGAEVTVLDPLPPAGGTSFGNAGMISADTAVPIALPGMLPRVPKWLTDPMGPLAVRPSYLPKAAPWLTRWVIEGQAERATRHADAMRAMHRDSLNLWRELLGTDDFHNLIRQSGQVYLWEENAPPPGQSFEDKLRARHGIKVETLNADEIRQLLPGIARSVTQGLLIPGNGFTVNPARLVQTLGDKLLQLGGEIRAEKVLKLIPAENGGWMLLTNIDNHMAEKVVVAGGVWSGALLAPLGYAAPIESERGYHALLPNPSVRLPVTVGVKSRGFGLTSMETGLRAAGTVEFGGVDGVPDERRAQKLVTHVQQLFPGITFDTPKFWTGHRPSTPDSLPMVGALSRHPNLYLCAGHGHFGMTGGVPSGQLLAQMIMNQTPSIDAAPYAPSRFAGMR